MLLFNFLMDIEKHSRFASVFNTSLEETQLCPKSGLNHSTIRLFNNTTLMYCEGVGPVYETEDPNQFMMHLENLMALGGGDEPEMCLSAVQVNSLLLCFFCLFFLAFFNSLC